MCAGRQRERALAHAGWPAFLRLHSRCLGPADLGGGASTRAAAGDGERLAVHAPVDARLGSARGAAAWSSRQTASRRGPSWVVFEHVFATEAGTALEPRKVSRWFDNLAKKVGVGGSMHTLRHTALTSMVLAGCRRWSCPASTGTNPSRVGADGAESSLGRWPSCPGRRDGGRRPA